MLELYYYFFTKFCDATKFEELELDADSLFALAEKELEDCIKPEMRAQWLRLRSNECVDNFTADAVGVFLPRTCCIKHKQHDKREPGLFKEEFRCTEMLCLCVRTYCCYDISSKNLNLAVNVSNKRLLELSGGGTLDKYRRVLNERYSQFRTIEDSEQTITLLPPMTKLRKVCLTFTRSE